MGVTQHTACELGRLQKNRVRVEQFGPSQNDRQNGDVEKTEEEKIKLRIRTKEPII